MTTEEKAKAYDEALERARKIQNGKGDWRYSDLIEIGPVLTEIFPQLHESEDEQTRKRLIEFISDIKSISESGRNSWAIRKDDAEMCNAFLAYLEKQKELPISAEEVLTKAGLKPYKDGNKWCILVGDNIQEGICGFGDTIDEALYEFLKEIMDLQKEQKPVSFSEQYNPNKYEVVVEGNATSLKRKEQKPRDYYSVRDEFDLDGNLKQKPNYCHYGGDPNVERCKYCSADCSARLTEEQKSIEDVVKDITKNKESAIKFLKSAGIMDDNGELAEMYRSEPKPAMIQWTGKNLKEVIDFTGKSPRFGEWFKSWDEFESYVHGHGDILKLFCEDGSHYEVPVGAWIVKTPDGYNIPSRFRFIQKPAEWTDLTWKDIVELEGIINNVHYEFRNGIGQESFGKEVLEKFREYKGGEYLDEKEQKPADEQFPPLEGLDAIKAKYYDDGFKNGFDEGVESVKPAEWSEDIIRKAIKEVGLTQHQIDWFKTNVFPPK